MYGSGQVHQTSMTPYKQIHSNLKYIKITINHHRPFEGLLWVPKTMSRGSLSIIIKLHPHQEGYLKRH
jgi:hypothetical protein